jgi:hypothetical protein
MVRKTPQIIALRSGIFARAILLVAVALFSLAPATAHAATPAQVRSAMEKAVAALYAQQVNGNWEHAGIPAGWGKNFENAKSLHWTGITAITVYALLCSGESESDKRLTTAIDFLAANPSNGVYASACRCLVWSRIKLTPALHAAAQKDVQLLLDSVRIKGEAKGLMYYFPRTGPGDVSYDFSTSQMGALGLSAIEHVGFEIPGGFWQLTEQAWQRHQYDDGAWSYADSSPPARVHTASMTAAGAATLLEAQAALHEETDCKGNLQDPHLDKAIAWLGTNFDATFDAKRELNGSHLEQYALFAISRVGAASGLRYFGNVDWYQRGCDYLVHSQHADGNWVTSIPAGTPLGLLFLAYGSAPVAVEKLDFALPSEPGIPTVAQWNQRPQDLLNFVDWMGRQLERRINWQVVSLSSPVEALHDAPVMMIEGSRPLNFSDDDRARLRQFVEDGGMIVGNADCDSDNFSNSFLKLGKELFPAYDFRDLPTTHPIFTNEQYRASKFRGRMRVQGLSNGVRELMLLPSADLSRAFQHRNELIALDQYQLFDDIILYAMDKSGLEQRGNAYIVEDDPAAPVAQTVKLARLQYDGNWDPEPGGWRRLAAVLHNSQKIALHMETVELGTGKLVTPPSPTNAVARPSDAEIRQMAIKRIPPADLQAAMIAGQDKLDALVKAKTQEIAAELNAAEAAQAAGHANFTIAHLTGTDALKLTDAQRRELKKFVEGGGTLIIDAAGGSNAFSDSAEQMLIETFGSDAAQLNMPLAPDAPIYRQPGHSLETAHYRHFALDRIARTNVPQLRGIKIGGRLAIIFSREDLSAGLVGEQVDGITGYTPASATELMTDIILSAVGASQVEPPVAGSAP